jgi:Ras-related protein Rab-5C
MHDLVYTISQFPPPGKYHTHFPQLDRRWFAELSVSYVKPKIILLGDAGVGKTSLLNCMKTNSYRDHYNPTVGAAYVQLRCLINGAEVKIAMWDTAGSEKYNALTRPYYRDAHGALVCFDLTSPPSFASVDKWLERIRAQCGEGVFVFLIGCKADLERQVAEDKIEQKCVDRALEYFETSSKTGIQVAELMRRSCLVGIAARLLGEKEVAKPVLVRLVEPEKGGKQEKKKCC